MSEMSWDLSEVVKSTEPKDILQELGLLMNDTEEFAKKYKGRISNLSANGIADMLEEQDRIMLAHDGAIAYSKLSYSADTTDPDANNLYSAFMDAMTKVGQDLAFLDIELGESLLSHPRSIHDPDLSVYYHYLERIRSLSPHLMSEAEEKIVIGKDLNGISAWSQLQGAWLSTRTFKMSVDGEEKELSLGEILSFINDPNRDNRRASYIAIETELEKNQTIWSYAIRSVCSDHLQMCKMRKYSSPMSSSLLFNDVEPTVIDAMMAVVGKNTDICQNHAKIKALLLGLPKMCNYDINAPLPSAPDKRYSWEDSKSLVLSAYRSFDDEFSGFVEDMFRRRHLDGEVRKGKVAGAFCDDWLSGRTAFVLQSFNGRISDVYTQAHELGHSIHSYLYSRSQRPSNCHISYCIAECGSLFGELLLTDQLLSSAEGDDERRSILVGILDGFSLSVFHVGARMYLEQSIYDAIERGEHLDGEMISSLWADSRVRMYGDSIDWSSESRWDWARVPHFYIPDLRFYNYPYIFAQLFVFAMYRLYKEQGKDFVPKFKALLSAGSSRSAAQLGAELGFDISKEEFWQKGMDQATAFLGMLQRLS